MKKAVRFCFFFMLVCAGSLSGRCIRVYTDFKANPGKYAPPFQTWQQALRLDFVIFGSAIILCLIAIIVLKIILHKRKQQEQQAA